MTGYFIRKNNSFERVSLVHKVDENGDRFFNSLDGSLVLEPIYFGIASAKKEVKLRAEELDKRTFGTFIFPKPGRKAKP